MIAFPSCTSFRLFFRAGSDHAIFHSCLSQHASPRKAKYFQVGRSHRNHVCGRSETSQRDRQNPQFELGEGLATCSTRVRQRFTRTGECRNVAGKQASVAVHRRHAQRTQSIRVPGRAQGHIRLRLRVSASPLSALRYRGVTYSVAYRAHHHLA